MRLLYRDFAENITKLHIVLHEDICTNKQHWVGGGELENSESVSYVLHMMINQ